MTSLASYIKLALVYNLKSMLMKFLRPYRIAILVFILIAFLFRIPVLKTRYFDPDEFQHLHGARQIYHGDIPYRDYFDHHTPFLHFILATLYPIFGEEIQILFAARILMMVFTAVILFLTFILARQLYGTDAGLVSVLFLSYVLIFFEKTIEIRPDILAVAFWLASMIFAVKGIQNGNLRRWHALSGLSMGIAIMFTQKSLFGLPGLICALMLPFIDRRTYIPRKQNLKLLISFLTGIIVPIFLTCLFFAIHNALWQFINCNFIMNSNWKVRFSPYGYVMQMIRQNPFFPVLGLAGLLVATALIYKEVRSGCFVPIFCTYSLIAGLFIMPVPYRQYYLLFLPMLAMYSAFILKTASDLKIRQLIGKKILLIIVLLVTVLIVIGLFYTIRISKPGVPHFRDLLHLTKLGGIGPSAIYLIFWAVSIILAVVFRRNYGILLFSIVIIIHPLDQMINCHERNDGQLADIQYIMSTTSPTDAVLDGWSGYGFLRPHAYYYYFLHSEMRAMLNEKELTDDLIDSAERNNTKIVIYDGDMRALPQKTQEYINSNYVPTGQGNLYIRR